MVAGLFRTAKGWLGSGDKFDARLFCWTLMRTAVQGAAMGYGLNQDPFITFFQVYLIDDTAANKALDKIGEKIGAKKVDTDKS